MYAEVKKAKDAVLKLVEAEREGEQIDRTLLKNVLGIFIEVGMGAMDAYEKDFEEFLIKAGETNLGSAGCALLLTWICCIFMCCDLLTPCVCPSCTQESGAFYQRKAAVWIQEDSTPDYLVKRWAVSVEL